MKRLALIFAFALLTRTAAASQISNSGVTVPLGVTLSTITWSNGALLTGTTGTSIAQTGSTKFVNTSLYGVIGSTTNDSAAAGNVGEYLSSSTVRSVAKSITSGTVLNIGSITLTPGDWDVSFSGGFIDGSSTSITFLLVSVSTISASLPTNDTVSVPDAQGQIRIQIQDQSAPILPGNNNDYVVPGVPVRVSVASSTTYYLVEQSVFTVSTLSGYGFISARRMR